MNGFKINLLQRFQNIVESCILQVYLITCRKHKNIIICQVLQVIVQRNSILYLY